MSIKEYTLTVTYMQPVCKRNLIGMIFAYQRDPAAEGES
jgi:hypothetical protein